MIKRYFSKTCVSINIVLPSKKSTHISFSPYSDGSSSYTTSSKDIQHGIENHYKYGKLFRLVSVLEENKTESKPEAESTEEDSTPTKAVKKVKVSDLSSAKDYLAETFGVSRTILRSTKQIVAQAEAHGIEFEGL